MDRYAYGRGYLQKGYTSQKAAATATADLNQGSNSPNAPVRASVIPDPVAGTTPSSSTSSIGEGERRRGSLVPLSPNHDKAKDMVDLAYSAKQNNNGSPTKADQSVKAPETHQQTSTVRARPQSFDEYIKKVHDEADRPHKSAARGSLHQAQDSNGIASQGDGGLEYKPKENGYLSDEYGRKSDRDRVPLEKHMVDDGGRSRTIRPRWEPALASQTNGSQSLGEPAALGKPADSSNSNGQTYPSDYSKHSQNQKDWAESKPAAESMTWSSGDDGQYRKNEATREPVTKNYGGWGRPRHVAWASTPDNVAQQSEPTYEFDINKRDRDFLGVRGTSKPTSAAAAAAAQSAYHNGPNGYGDGYNDYNNREGNGNYYEKTGGNWARPTFSSWTSPPRKGTQLSQPTSDIGKVIGLLSEAVNPTSSGVNAGYIVPTSTAPNKLDAYPKTNGSSLNWGWRYGNFKFPSQPR